MKLRFTISWDMPKNGHALATSTADLQAPIFFLITLGLASHAGGMRTVKDED